MKAPHAHVAAAATLAAVLGGCGARSDQTPAASATAAGPTHAVPLPALSGASAQIRAQIEQRHAALMALPGSGAAPADLASAYGEFGRLLMAARFYDAAEPALLDARDLAPRDARWSYYLADVYRRRGALDDAEREFERVIALTPDYLAAHVWLGRVYLDAGRPDRAESEFTRALAIAPTYAAEFGLGRVALQKTDYASAIEHLERALVLEPRASIVHYQLALAYRGAGQPERADAHLRLRGVDDVAPPDPLIDQLGTLLDNAENYYHRGQDAMRRGAFGEAVEFHRKGLALNPADWRLREILRNSLGNALLRTGDAAGAIAQFQEGIRQVPDRPEHYFSLGIAYLSQGRKREGIDELRAALKRDPQYAPAIAALRQAEGR